MANGTYTIPKLDPTKIFPSVLDTIPEINTSGITLVDTPPSLFSNLNFGNLL